MDTVGTFEMAEALSRKRLFTFVHKHYSVEQWMEFVNRIDSNQDVCCISLPFMLRTEFYSLAFV